MSLRHPQIPSQYAGIGSADGNNVNRSNYF
jgi:hypothetical protein